MESAVLATNDWHKIKRTDIQKWRERETVDYRKCSNASKL